MSADLETIKKAISSPTEAHGFLRRITLGEGLWKAVDQKTWNRICNIIENLKIDGGWIERRQDQEGLGWVIHINPLVSETGGASGSKDDNDNPYPYPTPPEIENGSGAPLDPDSALLEAATKSVEIRSFQKNGETIRFYSIYHFADPSKTILDYDHNDGEILFRKGKNLEYRALDQIALARPS